MWPWKRKPRPPEPEPEPSTPQPFMQPNKPNKVEPVKRRLFPNRMNRNKRDL